jgi:hypothetical protein
MRTGHGVCDLGTRSETRSVGRDAVTDFTAAVER